MKKTYYGFSRGLVSMTSSDSRCLIWIWQVMTSNVKYKLNFLATATRKCSALMLGGPCCRFAYSSCGRSGKPEQCARAGASWLKWVAMLHRLRGTGNYSFLTSVKDTFWIWKKCAANQWFFEEVQGTGNYTFSSRQSKIQFEYERNVRRSIIFWRSTKKCFRIS